MTRPPSIPPGAAAPFFSASGTAHPSAEQHNRGRRKHATRSLTIHPQRESKARREQLAREAGRTNHPRPATRGACERGVRPCPFVGCKWHLYLDVTESGSIKLNFPDLGPHELNETCVLDVAERGPSTLEATAEHLNLTRERVRQIEARAVARVQRLARLRGEEFE